MPYFSSRLRSLYEGSLARLPQEMRGRLGGPEQDLEKNIPRLAERFIRKVCGETGEDLKERYAAKDPLYLTELWLRYVQGSLMRVVYAAAPGRMPSDEAVRARLRVAGMVEHGSWYAKDERFSCRPLLGVFSTAMTERLGKVDVRLWDLRAARLFFSRAEVIAGETSWELYKRFDPKAERQMHLGLFYSLMPRTWRKWKQYQKIHVPYAQCGRVVAWFESNAPKDRETTWELYQRFDPQGEEQMHQGNFYTLMPRAWRKLYQVLNAPYADCKMAAVWFQKNAPKDRETSWELYRRYDPQGIRQMNQGQFYSLMPRTWRELEQYHSIDAPYADCVKAEVWFRANLPKEGETTWELYQRFDSKGERQMHQGHFYSLMPSRWREREHYQKIDASYPDCVKIAALFGVVNLATVRSYRLQQALAT